MTKQTYKIPNYDDVELGVTGDIVKHGSADALQSMALFERIVFGDAGEYTCWVQVYFDCDGSLTGDWDAVSEEDAAALGLTR